MRMIMNHFSIIVRYSRIFCERKGACYGVGFPEQVILMYLSEHGPVNQDTIARFYMIDKGAIAKTANRLEEKGFVERHENPDDKREKILSISDKGMGMIAGMHTNLEEWNGVLYEGISPQELETAQKVVSIMATNAIKALE
jgi:MarR family transcriptional regulator, transcriptional regulator for hemolysin